MRQTPTEYQVWLRRQPFDVCVTTHDAVANAKLVQRLVNERAEREGSPVRAYVIEREVEA